MADDFVNLHLHTDYSFLDGAIKVPELLARVADFGQTHVATTDHGNVHAVFPLFEQAKKHGVKPIAGSELYLAPGHRGDRELRTPTWTAANGAKGGGRPYYHLTVLAQNAAGWKNLARLSSRSFNEGFYTKPRVDLEILDEHSEGLVVLSGCMAGAICQALERGDWDEARRYARWFAERFPGRFYLEVQGHDSPGQAEMNAMLRQLGTEMGLPLVATNDSHFLKPEHHHTQTALCCLSVGATLDNPPYVYDKGLWLPNGEEMRRRMPGFEDAIANTAVIADSITFGFEKKYHVPAFPVPQAAPKMGTPAEQETQRLAEEAAYLRQQAEAGALARYGSPMAAEVRERLEYELGVITGSGYSGYILIVADLIDGARSLNVPVGPGRGSAAGSLVCYALGITEVDPLKWGLLFERFLNPDRVSMPDIDIDVGTEGRQAVIQWIRERYGAEAVGQIVTFGTMKARSAIKDAARVMQWGEPKEVEKVAALIPNDPNNALTIAQSIEQIPEVADLMRDSRFRRLFDTAAGLEGLTRHSSVHAGGVIIAPGPLSEYAPTMRVKTPSGDIGIATQCDMNAAEKIGLLKMDVLGIKTLDVIAKAVAMVHARPEAEAQAFDPYHPPLDDAAVFSMLRRGETVGVFQFESPLASDTLRAMGVDRLDDMVASNALLRPGPLDTGMKDEYIERKLGRTPVSYPHPSLEPVLRDTFGIITYQEQVMQAAQVMGGYSLAEADVLRKAVGKKDAALIAEELDRFVGRAVAKGTCTELEARKVAELIETFGRYGFNKSHAVAYSLVSYQSAYLKAHYPAEFYAALLTVYRSDRDYTMSVFAEMAARGVPLLPPDVNASEVEFGVTPLPEGGTGVRYSLVGIRDVGIDVSEFIVANRREHGPYKNEEDFLTRAIWNTPAAKKTTLERLAAAGALDGLGSTRAQWIAGAATAAKPPKVPKSKGTSVGQLAMFADLPALDTPPSFRLPDATPLDPIEALSLEHQALGVYVSGHPLDSHRELVKAVGATPIMQVNRESREGDFTIAGVVTQVERKVAKSSGKPYGIVRVEDATGGMTARVFPKTWASYEHLLRKGELVVLAGRHDEKMAEVGEGAREILVESVESLPAMAQNGQVAVVLDLAEQERTPALMERLKAILEGHAGEAPVLVRLDDGRTRRAQSRVALEGRVLLALREEIGADRVRLEAPPSDEPAKPMRRSGAFRGARR